MIRNTLSAIYTIITNNMTQITQSQNPNQGNRIQWVGAGLEVYIKNAFADAFDVDADERKHRYQINFSHEGSANNPPDLMLRGGDAIEVKKKNSAAGTIPLNSSYPKQKLLASSSMITEKCRMSEVWDIKDLLYVIGHVDKQLLITLWLVYGDCYAASADSYKKIADNIRQSVIASNLTLGQTNELARVNHIDPLGKTSLRVRGMWQIEHPSKFFGYIPELNPTIGTNFTLNAIMRKQKYDSFPENDREKLETLDESNLVILDSQIRSPDNPNEAIDAKIIRYSL
ncbi:MAG: NgoPII family restriction endonuclease [Phototrophicaceae bacterium]